AIAVLFAQGVFEHYFFMYSYGMDPPIVANILNGEEDDIKGLGWLYFGMNYSFAMGVVMLWVAGLLTVVTGYDYFRKAAPFLRDGK
ncbi:MAG: CDP-diacylglycerol--glycerol-3-phosphate 3-phosphatidyltransferase, partial [Amylibacter sp.]